MTTAKTIKILSYLVCDIFAAIVSWCIFWFFIYQEPPIFTLKTLFENDEFQGSLFLVLCFWILFYSIQGIYKGIYRKSRMIELEQTFFSSFVGVVIIAACIALSWRNNETLRLHNVALAAFFLSQFCLTYVFRFILTTHTIHSFSTGKIGFNTLLVGSEAKAKQVYSKMMGQKNTTGNKFLGFVSLNPIESDTFDMFLPYLGSVSDLQNLISAHQIEEVIIAVEDSEQDKVYQVITLINDTKTLIKVTPDTRDILLGMVKMTGIFQTPLILVSRDLLQPWQKFVKRVMDAGLSILAMIILSPVYLFIAVGVKLSSKGPVLYHQERIGLRGKPFQIYKFRSMYIDAEKATPMLSSKTDTRITPFGRFLRKVRLDEIPQFYNVLKGEMSLVGPRPERQFYIDQILQRTPEYKMIQMVKPGITSWGQVKFGYAENVDEMVERLQYDLLYLENMSIATDIKILFYTLLIIIQGRGK